VLALAACRSDGSVPPRPDLEAALARDLAARYGDVAAVHCAIVLGVPLACRLALADGRELALVVRDGDGAWSYAVAGTVIDARQIVARVEHELHRVGVAQRARCGPALQQVALPARLVCALSGGGAAYVDVGNAGSIAIELAIDPAAAAVRGEAMTPAHEQELIERSRALEHALDDGDDRGGDGDAARP